MKILLALFIQFGDVVSACDRPKMDWKLAFGFADHVVVGKVQKLLSSTRVQILPQRSLKGQLKQSIEVDGLLAQDQRHPERCQGAHLAVGEQYVFFVLKPSPGQSWFQAVDKIDGATPINPELIKAFEAIAPRAGMASPWMDQANGLKTKLVAARSRFHHDEDILLSLVLWNSSGGEKKLQSTSWPMATMSKCHLQIKGEKGRVQPVSTGLTQKDYEEYFSKHGPKFDLPLAKGDFYHLTLDRVNTAKPGWGYKERLGFQYYPLQPGKYQVAAECLNWGVGNLKTSEVQIEVLTTKSSQEAGTP